MGRPRSLTADQEREIRQLAEDGLSLRVIAERVGTSKDTVRRVLRPAAPVRRDEAVPVAAASARSGTSAPDRSRPAAVASEGRSEPPRLGLRPMTEADHWEMDRDRVHRLRWW